MCVILFFIFCIKFTIFWRSELHGWLFCRVGLRICVFMRYGELRLLVNMYVGS